MINLCVTACKRHDLLPGMLRSAFSGTVTPDALYIVDQADRLDLINTALVIAAPHVPVYIMDLEEFRGSEAHAINWYFLNAPEIRVIAHEDVIFAPTSLAKFVATSGDFIIDNSLGVISYSDNCRKLIGLYDTAISPNFFTYVDVDYEDRLALADIHPRVVYADISHLCNGTLKGTDAEDLPEFHRRTELARVNYEKKWGRPVTPGGHTIGRGMWRQEQQRLWKKYL